MEGTAGRTVGVIGGIGPESTIEYYRQLVAGYRARAGAERYPPVVIDSIDLTKMLALIGAGELEAVTAYLSAEIRRVAAAGADFAVLASNTPHVVYDELARRAPIPMISIVEATAKAAVARKVKRAGLLGTRYTMQGRFYPDVFGRHGLAVAAPEPEDLEWVHGVYLGELVNGVMRPETRERMLAVIASMRDRQQVDAVVLGGTELPLLLRDVPTPPVPLLDTTAIHVESILEAMLGGQA